jgi:hypothetical protein
MSFDTGAVQHLQDAHTEDGSGGASNADDETRRLALFHAASLSMKCEAARKEAPKPRMDFFRSAVIRVYPRAQKGRAKTRPLV